MADQIIKSTVAIDFRAEKASLDRLKKDLEVILKMTTSEYRANSSKKYSSAREALEDLKKIKQTAGEVNKALEDAFNVNLGTSNLTKFSQAINKIGINKINKDWKEMGIVGQSALRNLNTSLTTTTTQLKQSNKLLDDMATSFKNTVKWGISSSVWNTMTASLEKSWNFTKNLDKSLNNIRIVAEKSADEMERFAKQATAASKQLGATTLDYTNASLIYYQQGDTAEQVAQKADITLKMANVLGTNAEEVSNYLTAIWNNFDNGSKSLEYYADVLTKLGAATASSAEEIADGLEKFAAVGETVGLSYEYATSALTTITAQTRQSADTVGTALKTLFARIQDLELGKTLDDGTSLGKYSEALYQVGINIKDSNGELKDMDDILDEMGSKWETLSKAQQVALAQTVAGTRQYNQLVALMDNWSIMEDNLEMAQNATGELEKQQDIYMESLEAHLNQLTSASERFMSALIDEESATGLVDALTSIVTLLANFTESIGGGRNALTLLGSVGMQVFGNQISDSLYKTALNMQKTKEEAEQLKNVLDNLSSGHFKENFSFLSEDIGEEKIKKFYEAKRTLYEKQQLLNEEEQQQVQEAIEKAENSMKTYEMRAKIEQDIIKSSLTLTPQIAYEGSNFEDIEGPFKKEILKYEENLKIIKDKYKQAKDNMLDEGIIEQLQTELLYIPDLIEKTDWEDINPLKDKINKIFEGERNGIIFSEEDIQSNEKLIENYLKQVDQAIGKADLRIKKEKTALDQLKILDKRTSTYVSADLGLVIGQSQHLKERDRLVELTNFAAGLGKVTSGIMALSNAYNILNSQDLSTFEKTIQITMMLTTAIPSVITGLEDLKNGFSAFKEFLIAISDGFIQKIASTTTQIAANTALEASEKKLAATQTAGSATAIAAETAETQAKVVLTSKQIAANAALEASEMGAAAAGTAAAGATTAAGTAATGATTAIGALGSSIGALLVPIAAVIAVIAALASIIYVAVKAWNADADAAKRAAESATELAARYEEVKTAAEDMKKSISDYTEGVNALEKLQTGTEEYKNALEKANEKAREMIETYKLFDDYHYENGLIVFKEGVLENLEKEQDNKVLEVEARKYEAQLWAQYTETRSKTTDLRRELPKIQETQVNSVYNGNTKEFEEKEQSVFRDLSSEEVQQLADALLTLKESSEETYNEMFSSKDKFKEMVSEMDGIPSVIKDNIEAFADNKGALKEYTEWLKGQYEESNYAAEQLVKNQITQKYGEEIKNAIKDEDGKVDEGRYNQIIEVLAKNNNDITKQINKDMENIDPTDYNSNKRLRDSFSEYEDIDNDEDLMRKYLTTVRGMDEQEVASYTYKGGNNKGSIYTETGDKVLVDKSDDEMREELARTAIMSRMEKYYGNKMNEKDTINALDKIIEATDNSLGGSFSDAILNSLASEDKKIDFSKAYSELSPEDAVEWQETALNDPNRLLEKLGIDEETLKNAGFKSAEDFAIKFAEGLSNYKWDKEAALTTAMTYQAEDIEKFGLDSEAVEEYASHLMDIAEASEEVEDGLSTNAKAAAQVATVISRANKGLENLNGGFDEWSEILKDGNKETQEYSEALADMKQSLSDVFGVNSKDVDSDFVVENLDLIEEAAAGSEEALADLQKALTKDIIMDITVENQLGEVLSNDILTMAQQIQESLSSLDIGEINDADFVASCSEIIRAAGMTAEQAQSYFNSMGMQVKFKTEPKEITTKKPITTTTRMVKERDFLGNPTKWEESSRVTGYDEVKEMVEVPAIGVNGEPVIESITNTGGTSNLNTLSIKNGGGKGSSSKVNKKDSEKDRYQRVNTRLDHISSSLNKLEKQKERLLGGNLLKNLINQTKELNEQFDVTTEKLKIANGEKSELQKEGRKDFGINFDKDGLISNYSSRYDYYYAQYEAAYNAYDKKSTEKNKERLEEAEKNLDNFEKYIQEYDELVGSFIPGLEQDLQDNIDQQIETKLEAFNLRVNVTLELDDAKKQWLDFEKDILNDFDENRDFVELGGFELRRLSDLQFSGAAIEDNIKKLLQENNILDKNGIMNIFGAEGVNNPALLLEQLKEMQSKGIDIVTEVKETYKQLQEYLLSSYDATEELIGKQTEMMDAAIENYQHNIRLIELTMGKDSYSNIREYQESIAETSKDIYEIKHETLLYWQQELSQLKVGTKEWEAVHEKYMSALQEDQAALESYLESAKELYVTTLNDIFETLRSGFAGGLSTSYIEQEWDLANKYAEKYFDTINKGYESQKIEDEFQDLLDKYQDSATTQSRIKKIMDEQMKILQEQDKLSQYDIDRARLKIQLLEQEIALEEARDNKNKMRLRRDSQGNYSYQYVADEDAVKEAEAAKRDKANELYNFDKENLIKATEERNALYTEFQNAMIEANQIEDKQIREATIAMLEERYKPLFDEDKKELEQIIGNIQESAREAIAITYGKDSAEMTAFKENPLEWILSDTGLGSGMLDFVRNIPSFDEFYEELKSKTTPESKEYDDTLEEGKSKIEKLTDGMTEVSKQLTDWADDFGEHAAIMKDDTNQLKEMVTQAANVVEKFKSLGDRLKNLETAIEKIYNKSIKEIDANDENIKQQTNATSTNSKKETATTTSDTKPKEEEKKPQLTEAEKKKKEEAEKLAKMQKEHYELHGNSPLTIKYSDYYFKDENGKLTKQPRYWNNQKLVRAEDKNGVKLRLAHLVPIGDIRNGKSGIEGVYSDRNIWKVGSNFLCWDGKKYVIINDIVKNTKNDALKFDTGGYTGDWASSGGRWALLHEKELVLNKEDTKNMLNAIEIVRQLTQSLGNGAFEQLARMSKGQLYAGLKEDGTLQQNVNIEAHFPNVEHAGEIEEALNNLVNAASQKAGYKDK